jgi:branched-chain amino acid transport system permease protein
LTGREQAVLAVSAVAFAAAASVPFADTGYWLSLAISIAMYAGLATSWALFSGPTNYISLATAAFFGIGMYIAAAGVTSGFAPFPVLVLLAAAAGAVLAALVGLATLRISGIYFVIFTLGLSELIRQVTVWGQATVGGQAGIIVLTGISDRLLYWLFLATAGMVFLIGWWIGRSRLGFALRIIGNDEVVAVHSGINTARAKVVLFVISCTFASVIGAFAAPRYSYVEPTIAFSAFITFQVVIMALLGGAHRLWGPLLGVIPFTLLLEWIDRNFPSQTSLLLGISFLLIVYLIPRGIVGLIEDAWRRRRADAHA